MVGNLSLSWGSIRIGDLGLGIARLCRYWHGICSPTSCGWLGIQHTRYSMYFEDPLCGSPGLVRVGLVGATELPILGILGPLWGRFDPGQPTLGTFGSAHFIYVLHDSCMG